jgi:hypothetical protein
MKRKETLQSIMDISKWAEQVTQYIDSIPYNDKIELYYAVSRDFSHDLPVKPDGWESFDNLKKREYINEILYIIEGRVGWKGIQRYHYTKVLGYTDLQFEDWWDSQKR